jgi:hypothetical protein
MRLHDRHKQPPGQQPLLPGRQSHLAEDALRGRYEKSYRVD